MAKQTIRANHELPLHSRRDFIKTGAASAAGASAGIFAQGCEPSATNSPKAKPNILLLITDQHHIDTIAAAGCSHVRTPALDRLVENGVIFSESYCSNPICSPSRAALFTGRTSCETGVYRNELPIRQDIPSMGEWFRQESDYETIYTGKWHVPATYTTDIPGFSVPMTGLIGQGNFCDTAVSMACDAYIRNRSRDKPFLMVASFMQPHDICEWLRLNLMDQPELRYPELMDELPELPPNFIIDKDEPETMRKKREREEPALGKWSDLHWRYYLWSYYRHIEMVDAEIGRILQALEDTGQQNDTLVVFTADHGEGTAHHKMVRKSSNYDEAAKVPLIVSWPGELSVRSDDSCLVSGMDIMPTLCDFAGISAPAGMKGVSLRPVLEGESPRREFIALECRANMGQMIRTNRYKYSTYKNDPVEQLFDMIDDPYEMKNLANDASHAGDLDEHKKLLKDWVSGLDIAPNVPEENRWFV